MSRIQRGVHRWTLCGPSDTPCLQPDNPGPCTLCPRRLKYSRVEDVEGRPCSLSRVQNEYPSSLEARPSPGAKMTSLSSMSTSILVIGTPPAGRSFMLGHFTLHDCWPSHLPSSTGVR